VIETDHDLKYVESLASFTYRFDDVSARLSSGSFRTDGMVVIPCSMKTLSAIANGFEENLMIRAAMVTLKERRPLILVPRETPLALPHIRNLLSAAEAGAIMLPAMPSFYHRPKTVNEIVDHLVGKVLDTLGLEHDLFSRWDGPPSVRKK
jgi:4-hydroxy-3-polyprenylbenzoate decarboxylase